MHPPAATRISQHPSYHQQMDVNAHQYGLSHNQQNHGALQQHQPHQSMPSHAGGIGPGIQGHPNPHLHHAGAPPLHHVPRQPQGPPSSVGPSHAVPSQMPYASPHHSVPMSYQHQVQHPLDVNVTNQYAPVKPGGIETGSPQYRPPFPQLSPQMSPRAQMSPRQQAQAQQQLSPRPIMSPVKGPSASPLNSRSVAQSPATPGPTPVSGSFTSQNTLQALEQMVLPASGEYPFQRNPTSPAVSHNIVSSPTQWNPSKIPTSMSNLQIESTEQVTKSLDVPSVPVPKQDQVKTNPVTMTSVENKIVDKNQCESEISSENNNSPSRFLTNTSKDSMLMSTNNSIVTTTPTNSVTVSAANIDHKENVAHMQHPNEIYESVDKSKEESKIDIISNVENKLETKQCESVTNLNEPRNQNPNLPSSAKVDTTSEHSSNSTPQQTTTKGLITHAPNMNAGNNKYDTSSTLTVPRSQGYPAGSFQNVQNLMPQGISPSAVSTTPPSMQNNQNLNMSPAFQTSQQLASTTIPNIQSNIQPPHTIQHTNITNTVSSSVPGHNSQGNNMTCIPPAVPNILGNIQQPLHNNSSNMTTSVQGTVPTTVQSMQAGMPMNSQNIHGNLGPNIPTNQSPVPNVPHNMTQNMILMGSNNLPHPNLYPATHHQEIASLQQQIQEIYCLPPSNENREKVRCFQERLSMLQHHETNDKCSGGPNCVLQNPIYGSKMVESPQVTSTTGRGRGKGPAKPRKPRAKKEKLSTISQPLDLLPVSEDCVTAGTGLPSHSEIDAEPTDDIANLDSSALTIDDIHTEKIRKQRGPRKGKERKPRTPKEPKAGKDLGDKPVKERKKREPKDPNAPKRRRNTKKGVSEVYADTTTCNDVLETDNIDNSMQDQTFNKSSTPVDTSKVNNSSQELSLDDTNVTDFDDIPVSKIAIKELLEEAEAKKELADKDDDLDSLTYKKRSKKRSSGGRTRRTPVGKRRKRGGVPDSDGEPDDLVSTPPPSPPPEGDDSLKRRSARNTQRKKYTDDVLLRLSDEEFSMAAPKQDKDLEDLSLETRDSHSKPEGTPKPNYIYVNTTEEDSMIVQHVLACRMGKREMKIEVSPSEKPVPVKPDDDKLSAPKECDENKESHEVNAETLKCETTEGNENTDVANDPPKVEEEQKKEVIKIDPEKENKDLKPIMVDVEEYFVKYRNFSYLHCEWKTEEELYKGDKRIYSKIKRFKQKQAQQLNIFELLDDEPFNPDYVEVERILDMSENQDPANNTVVKHYLVKWKSLQYEDSTWELEEDIDVDKIRQYKIFSEIPPKEKWKFKKRPSADLWTQLKESPLYKGGNTLRPYQLEGLNWLLFSWHNNRNCILADEMGLGKTIQSLTFVNSVWEYGIRGPFLIIAPLSTIPNWQREFEGWTEMNVIVYHGSQQSKSMIQEYEFYYKNENGEPIKELTKFNVLITTFEIIVTDFQELKLFNWRLCVIDEAHRLKNRNCKLLEGLRQLHLEHRVLLSGTPLQNNVNELFSLLNFLEPSQFSSNEAFLTEFGQLKTESEVLKLQALLKPMMLRRLKEDVEKTLAPKEETIIEVELTNIQKKYYRAILERNFSFLQKGTTSAANIPNLMNTMMELRKCCIHPYLLNGAEDQIQFDYKQANGEDKEAYYKALIQSSGKMVLVDKLLPKLKAGGHRVLIFSQMVRCLDILEDYLVYKKYPFERIDGRIRGNLRQEAIDRFSKPDSDRFVFLLCTKAGGLGINLTAADTVIIYDSDWNPQNDLQAQARCHRIGQQKMVKIYRLICRNSYEREMFDKASLKLGLDKAILQSMNTSQGKETGLKQLSKKEIEDLLKKGAYGAVMDEDNAGDKFCEEDIEMILARRTQVIQMESEKGSTFSKASFAATDQRSDIDIRDPDFWNKWAKKAEIDTTEKKEDEDLIVTEPRKRTVIKRYGHDDGPMEMSDMEATPDSDEDEEGK